MLAPYQKQEKSALRHRGNLIGAALLSMEGLSGAVSVILAAAVLIGGGYPDFLGTYVNEAGETVASQPIGYILANMVLYIVILGGTALVGWLCARSTGARPLLSFTRLSPSLWVAFLLFGMGLCVFSNIISYGTTLFFQMFALYPVDVPITADGTLPTLLLDLVSTAVLPALLEEFLCRGVMIGLLRPAGDRTAILVSAVLFAVMHGTLNQIPFAFVLGLVFGFLYIRTGNLWLPIAVHFLNNAMAVILSHLYEVMPEEQVTLLTYAVFAVLALVGAIATAFLRLHPDQPLRPSADNPSSLRLSGRIGAALLAPTLIIYLIMAAFTLTQNVVYDPERYREEMQITDQDTPPDSDEALFGDGQNEKAVITWR